VSLSSSPTSFTCCVLVIPLVRVLATVPALATVPPEHAKISETSETSEIARKITATTHKFLFIFIMGKLNLLPHKSWHVYSAENVARVKRDEERAAAEEAAKAQQQQREVAWRGVA
jgi:hypothetical protein